MRSLNFNDGYESFMVNDDPNRVIRFNPADPEIINRVLSVQSEFGAYQIPEGIELNPDGSPKTDWKRTGHMWLNLRLPCVRPLMAFSMQMCMTRFLQASPRYALSVRIIFLKRF